MRFLHSFPLGIICLFMSYSFAGKAAQSGDFIYEVGTSTITITGYVGTDSTVAIPDTINGMPVTSIGEAAFIGSSKFASIILPQNMTQNMGSFVYAFAGCTALTQIKVSTSNPRFNDRDGVLYDKMQRILIQFPIGRMGGYAIPDGVTGIADFAFNGCTSLTSIDIPHSVTSIMATSITDCDALTNIVVDPLNPMFSDLDGVLFDNSQEYLINCPAGRSGIYSIPDGVTHVADYAFNDCIHLTSIILPNSVIAIGRWAFERCTTMTSIIIPDSVITIGMAAFSECTGLRTITMSKNVRYLDDSLFWRCSALTSVYFTGSSPSSEGEAVFSDANQVVVYYLPGTTGWSSTFDGRPTAEWLRAPNIVIQPANRTNFVGGTATFTVSAIGTAPITYQWRLNETNIQDATNRYFAIENVQADQVGQYSVTVSNPYGTIASSNATLLVESSLLHFDPLTKVNGTFQTRVNGAKIDLVTIEISTNMVNWIPFQTTRVGVDGFVVQIVMDRKQTFLRASTRLTGSTNAPEMVWINPGSFTMGSPDGETGHYKDESPQTHVLISRGFWMGKRETTQAEYLGIMGNNSSFFTGDLRRPVERVSWDNASNYCGKLTARERAVGLLPEGYIYRLPTEAEWEFACRAGSTGEYSTGSSFWSMGDSGNTTQPVGELSPNAWGLFDMHGNVSEWCLDWYAFYPGGFVTDRLGVDTGVSIKLVRGGDWGSIASACRSAFRQPMAPGDTSTRVGFRPVLAAVE